MCRASAFWRRFSKFCHLDLNCEVGFWFWLCGNNVFSKVSGIDLLGILSSFPNIISSYSNEWVPHALRVQCASLSCFCWHLLFIFDFWLWIGFSWRASSSLCVLFSLLWMPGDFSIQWGVVNFTLLGTGYFHIPVNLLWSLFQNMVKEKLLDPFGSCFKYVSERSVLSLGLILSRCWGKTLQSPMSKASWMRKFHRPAGG